MVGAIVAVVVVVMVEVDVDELAVTCDESVM